MSRDIFVQDLPQGISSVSEIPEDFHPRSICSRSAVISAIKDLVPFVDFSDPTWGKINNQPLYYIEVNMGDSEQLEGFTFHVSGGAEAEKIISSILSVLNLRALDPESESGLFHPCA